MLERGIITRILFPAPQPSYTAESFPKDLIWVPLKDYSTDSARDSSAIPPIEDGSVPCLLLRYPSARFLIIFFHSNAEDLGRCRHFCCYLREQFQVHVLAVEYPGYGICPGSPNGETVLENARAALRFATDTLKWPLDSIKVFGRSIGTGPAIGLASVFSFAGVILVTPFLSIQELFRDRVGPLAGLVEEWFPNQEAVLKVTSPTMIIHGQRDELIACRHGETLYELLRSRKLLVSPPEMEHNTNLLTNLQYFVLPMFQFFALPDYVFQEMHVPEWAFDKRRAGPCGQAGQSSAKQESNVAGSAIRLPLREPSLQADATTATVGPDAEEALRRIEEFAGKLSNAELSSDNLCEMKDNDGVASSDEQRRQEQVLRQLVNERQCWSSGMTSAAEPLMPRLFGKKGRFGQVECADTIRLTGWCSRGRPSSDCGSDHGYEANGANGGVTDCLEEEDLAPDSSMPRVAKEVATSRRRVPRGICRPMMPGGFKASPSQVDSNQSCDSSMWLRLCGADRNVAMIDLHEADAPEGLQAWAVNSQGFDEYDVSLSSGSQVRPRQAVSSVSAASVGRRPIARNAPGPAPPPPAAPDEPLGALWRPGVTGRGGVIGGAIVVNGNRSQPLCCSANQSDPLLSLAPRPPTRPSTPRTGSTGHKQAMAAARLSSSAFGVPADSQPDLPAGSGIGRLPMSI